MAKGRKTGGRVAGTPNKVTALLKDQILQAGADAHPEGMVGYLKQQAQDNPPAFMTLLGKVLPTQVTGPNDGPVQIEAIAVRIVDADKESGDASA